jgi:hypothetical protein
MTQQHTTDNEDSERFKAWAKVNFGQGYSFKKEDGTYINAVTRWSAKSFKAGFDLAATPQAAPVAASEPSDAQRYRLDAHINGMDQFTDFVLASDHDEIVHALETICDPSGMVREIRQLKDTNQGLQKMYRAAVAAQAAPVAVQPAMDDCGCIRGTTECKHHPNWPGNRRAPAQAAPVAAIRDQALEDAAEERDALIKENDLLRQHAAKQISDGTMLTGIVIRNGAAEIGLEGGACGLLADSFAKQFLDGGAMNYLELKFESQTVMPGVAFVVTLQRVDGETPAQQLKAAQAERDALKADAKQAPATQIRDQALEDAAKECENQVPTGCSTHIADVARNQGIRMCTDAIRAMKGAT